MKTTIDLPDALMAQLKRKAAKEDTTLRDLVSRAIRQFLSGGNKPGKPFKLKDGSVGGKGLAPGIREGDWAQISEIIYEGRGGVPDWNRPAKP